MNDNDKGKLVYILWIIIMVFIVVVGLSNVITTTSPTTTTATDKYFERVNFCNSNPCVCRCESAGNGGLEECTHLCRGGY